MACVAQLQSAKTLECAMMLMQAGATLTAEDINGIKEKLFPLVSLKSFVYIR
jgi:hypothetical protein